LKKEYAISFVLSPPCSPPSSASWSMPFFVTSSTGCSAPFADSAGFSGKENKQLNLLPTFSKPLEIGRVVLAPIQRYGLGHIPASFESAIVKKDTELPKANKSMNSTTGKGHQVFAGLRRGKYVRERTIERGGNLEFGENF